MEDEFHELTDRVRAELRSPQDLIAYERLLGLARKNSPAGREELARMLVAVERPLWAREIAAFILGCAGDKRAFETLVLLLNYRDPVRCATAAHALARLGDPRTARAAAALATNPLRTAYALHPVRLLAELRAPQSVPALIATLERLLTPHNPYWRVALACVEGLGALGDRRAVPALTAAVAHPRLAAAAAASLARLGVHEDVVAQDDGPEGDAAKTAGGPGDGRDHGPYGRAARGAGRAPGAQRGAGPGGGEGRPH
ncbi:HEAT repeat domain-containing protein [Streptomyces sioyaensis]|uniref:HEAT repeat domain-containing protein n=1 Tax=Streptomyces sioyaensis TaxID=67364 RepID=A0A4V1NNV1_9ACTN|nr:HEAT repeat domain-containing protein [Streptomyces sioyaensis]MBM4792608.1 HEAT repeat domain-containing protein [Streptomyces sioyaensis]RXS59619.1 HEAT repeat domain-containing protein [Streptomyces sioyaensis]